MSQHFDFTNLLNIDITSRPGEAFLKCIGFLTVGNIFDTNLFEMHLPPIILEIARVLAYLGASVAFFKFVISMFKTKQSTNNPDTDKEESK
jgi:hypothetical protein